MKKILQFLLMFSFLVYSTSTSGSVLAQSIALKEIMTIGELFEYIEKKYEYSVFYETGMVDLEKKIKIDTNQQAIDKLMQQALKGTNLSYTLVDKHIVIKRHKAPKNKQQLKISGIVTDNNDFTIPGVSILIKGTSKGTISDFDGNYSLEVENLNDTLIFSFVGYDKKIEPINGRTRIDVVLQTAESALDEVVVIGYSTQKKSSVTGSVATIDTDDLAKVNVPDITQAMQGLAAGVNITQNTGAPGEGVQVRIRGLGSVTGVNSPLYIVDGVPTKDAMNNLSPSDIKSISVLKDAASAAIYGSRASNGVILITTNKGNKQSEPKITYNADFGIQKHGKLTEMTNKNEYAEVFNEAADYFNNNPRLIDHPELHRPKITDEMLANSPDIDYLESIFRTAKINRHYLSISGGNEKTQYNLSGSHFKQEGIMIGSDYKKLTGKLSITSKIKERLTIGTNINISKSENDIVGSSGDGYGGNGGSAVRYAFFRNPMIPIYDENDDFVDLPERPDLMGDGYNPVGLLRNTDNKKEQKSTFGDVNASFKISESLQFNTILGVDNSEYKQRRFNKTWGNSENRKVNETNSLNVYHGSSSNWTFSNVLNFNKSIKKAHNISATLGTESVNNKITTTEVSDRDFADQTPTLVFIGNGTGIMTSNEHEVTYKLLSFFGRINYNYLQKYFFSALIRRDGSSRFNSDNRWGNFYSASLGWDLKMDFFPHNEKIDQMKLRLSYGAVGNQEIPDFAYLERITQGYQYPFGNQPNEGSATYKLGNTEVQWETSNQIDIGLDMSLFNNQLNIGIDYFRKTTDNLLLSVSIPSSAGYADSPIINTGGILNTGFELSVEYKKYYSDKFSWHARANGTWLHNEMIDLDNPILAGRIDNGVYATKTEEGHPIGSFYLYEMEGIFQNETEIVTHAFQGNDIKPGDVMFKDQNGDGIIDAEDRTHHGSAIPVVTAGLTIGCSFHQFDFSMFWSGAFGQKIYNQIATDIEGFYRPFNLTKRYYDERWTGEGTSNTQPRACWEAKSNNARPSSRFLEDGSYLKLKNIQIGYTLPNSIIEKIKVDKLRIYVSGTNLYMLTKYSGLDPELTTSDNTKHNSEAFRVSGIDWGTYPAAFTITGGLQLSF